MGNASRAWTPGRDVVRAEAPALDRKAEARLEPMLWGLFSLGGFLTAFLLPVTMFLLFFAVPLGLWPASRIGYDAMSARLSDLLVQLFFLLLIAGSLFHGMHRLRHMLLDAGFRSADGPLSVILYGVAVIGSLVAFYYTILIHVPLPFA